MTHVKKRDVDRDLARPFMEALLFEAHVHLSASLHFIAPNTNILIDTIYLTITNNLLLQMIRKKS